MARTTIHIEQKTRQRILETGRMKESYDEFINRMIDAYLKHKTPMEER